MKKTKVAILAIAIVMIAYLIFSNQSSRNTTSHSIKVGVIAPMSSDYGFLGESFKNSILLAIGNDPKIQVVFEDDKFDAKTGLSAYQKLTSIDHVDILIVEDSPTLDAITPLVHQSNIPTILAFEAKEHTKDSIFQMIPFSYPLFSELGKFASEKYNKIALVYSNASDVLVTDADYFKQGVPTGALVNETKVTNSSDFRSEVTKILASNPDAVTNILTMADGIKFIKELNAQKGNRKVSLICDANTEFVIGDYIKALGTSTFDGCISTNLPNMTSESFKSDYKAKFGSDPVIGADWGYDAISIVKNIMDLPKDKWVEKIQSSSFAGISGKVSFDENGTRYPAAERHEFKDGKFVKIQ